MRLHPKYIAAFALATLLLANAEPGAAQRRRAKKAGAATATPASTSTNTGTTNMRPESVVMLPEGARPRMDTALLNPEPKPRSRRRFEVKVVPATAPGRSRQEVLYSDSLARQPQRR